MSKLAYLVIREGTQWNDIFRLVPGQTATVGRASNNQIVIKDECCSRNHLEIFSGENKGEWYVRDLNSRNGTLLDERLITGEQLLSPNDVLVIGDCQLLFVHEVSAAFGSTAPRQTILGSSVVENDDETFSGELSLEENGSKNSHFADSAEITHRKNESRFLQDPAKLLATETGTPSKRRPIRTTKKSQPTATSRSAPRTGRIADTLGADSPQQRGGAAAAWTAEAAGRLARLAFSIAQAPDVSTLANYTIETLLNSVQVDAGGLFLHPAFLGAAEGEEKETLRLITSATRTHHNYQKVSPLLAKTVLREGEAILARNIADDSGFAGRDSQGELLATSVLIAPIRRGKRVVGLVHLYSTEQQIAPNSDELEFTLAVADILAVALTNLLQKRELTQHLTRVKSENEQLREQLAQTSEIIGNSRAMRKVFDQIIRAAGVDATVLVRGESGVGKELVSRAVHANSKRRDKPFLCLNCAALASELLPSELFGHEKGAFTGATERKVGKFEAANTGTLVLDEIGEMSNEMQAKFLRVLEGHSFERVGGNKPIKTNVRVISATNRDLEQEVTAGNFRRDLFFRLRVVEILVPPLRERGDDILLLADHFLTRFKGETGRRELSFLPEARELLRSYHWPGNVRELKNVVERAVVLASSETIAPSDLLLSNLELPEEKYRKVVTQPAVELVEEEEPAIPLSLVEMEQKQILAALEFTQGNKSKAAELLGVERTTLDRKLKKYGLKAP